jgi:hypothetical protein
MTNVAVPTVEFLNPGGLIIDVDTFDVTLHLTDKELWDGTFRFRALLA